MGSIIAIYIIVVWFNLPQGCSVYYALCTIRFMADILIKLKKGLDIPLGGEAGAQIENTDAVSRVAFMANEYHDLRPDMQVAVGDQVRVGQVLFRERRCPDICYVAPASGEIEAINRGQRRVLQSIVIKVKEDAAQREEQQYESYTTEQLDQLSKKQLIQHLLSSGLWTAFKTRPYSVTPNPNTHPHSIFVTAIDTQPLAPDPAAIIHTAAKEFATGVRILSRLFAGQVFVCTAAGVDLQLPQINNVKTAAFSGPHPAGLAGTHIHFLDPAQPKKTVWTIGYQDVIAIGDLFLTGCWPTQRIVALAGPGVKRPRLLRTRLGACVSELYRDNLREDETQRVIAGSVLNGWKAQGWGDFLGRFTCQITVLAERAPRRVLGWLRPNATAFSISRAVSFNFFRRVRPVFSCAINGSPRAFVPLGLYERVFPLTLLPTQLLRSLLINDTAMAQKLGCLELDEEDLALCSYVCPSKHEFGVFLRTVLHKIEKEG